MPWAANSIGAAPLKLLDMLIHSYENMSTMKNKVEFLISEAIRYDRG